MLYIARDQRWPFISVKDQGWPHMSKVAAHVCLESTVDTKVATHKCEDQQWLRMYVGSQLWLPMYVWGSVLATNVCWEWGSTVAPCFQFNGSCKH